MLDLSGGVGKNEWQTISSTRTCWGTNGGFSAWAVRITGAGKRCGSWCHRTWGWKRQRRCRMTLTHALEINVHFCYLKSSCFFLDFMSTTVFLFLFVENRFWGKNKRCMKAFNMPSCLDDLTNKSTKHWFTVFELFFPLLSNGSWMC